MQTRIVQKALIFNSKNQMLMLRRSKTDVRRPLQWDFPGGLYEDGEELIASVTREISEETGLVLQQVRPIYSKTEVRKWNNGTREVTENVVFIFYTARASSDKVELSFEHDQFHWKALEQAVNEFEYPIHIEVMRHTLDNHIDIP